MRDLLARLRPPERQHDYPSAVDLYELLCWPDQQQRTQLWFTADGQLAAFSMLDNFNNLLHEIDPACASLELEQAVVAWAEDCLRRAAADDAPPALDASCQEADTARLEMLQRNGFAIQPLHTLRLRRSLDQPVPAPRLPSGFQITSAAALLDQPDVGNQPGLAERIAALHRAAFGTEHMTVEERQIIMSAPGYDPALDLLAVAPDGRLAGYCTCGVETPLSNPLSQPLPKLSTFGGEGTVGHTDPLAIHPDFQRMGLGRSLLLAGMRLLRERGMSEARLGTSSDNLAMQGTAMSVGFEVYETVVWLSKPVT